MALEVPDTVELIKATCFLENEKFQQLYNAGALLTAIQLDVIN